MTAGGPRSAALTQTVYHNAGLGGTGGSSYIDNVILQQVDKSSVLTASSDGTLETRYYYLQNWRHDVVEVLTASGKRVESIRYSAYGDPLGMPAGDGTSDGVWNKAEENVIIGWTTGYDATYDTELDGDVDAADATHANSITGGFQTLGRAVLSSVAVGNRKGYAGYEHNWTLSGTKWDVRNRVLDSDTGRWSRRDPLGYVDGMGLYRYARGKPIRNTDPLGLSTICNYMPPPVNIVVCGNDKDADGNIVWSGCIVLAPGECTPDGHDWDFYYIPGDGWYKCRFGPCNPSRQKPDDATRRWKKGKEGVLHQWPGMFDAVFANCHLACRETTEEISHELPVVACVLYQLCMDKCMQVQDYWGGAPPGVKWPPDCPFEVCGH